MTFALWALNCWLLGQFYQSLSARYIIDESENCIIARHFYEHWIYVCYPAFETGKLSTFVGIFHIFNARRVFAGNCRKLIFFLADRQFNFTQPNLRSKTEPPTETRPKSAFRYICVSSKRRNGRIELGSNEWRKPFQACYWEKKPTMSFLPILNATCRF